MKKIIIASLIVTLFISFCGCGGANNTEPAATAKNKKPAATGTVTADPDPGHANNDPASADNDPFSDFGEPDVQQLTGRLFRSDDYIMHDNGDGTAFVIQYEGSESEVVFPAEVEGLSVTGIWTYSLSNTNTVVRKVTLPKSIKTIAYCALASSGLETIEVDGNNPYLKSVDGILYSKDGKTLICYPGANCSRKIERKYVMPDSVTTIATGAFWYDVSLMLIEVGSGNKAFKAIDGVVYTKDGKTLIWYPAGKMNTIYHIPDGVTGIAHYAFVSTKTIEQIFIPASVEKIARNAFLQCMVLKFLTVDEANRNYYSDDGKILYNKDKTELVIYTPAMVSASFIFLDGITKIGDYACFACKFVDNAHIPDTVVEIGFDAFKYCSWLDVVELPAGLKLIGENAFADCKELMTIKFAGTVAEWEKIEKRKNWKGGTTPEITVQCSDGDVIE